MKSGTEEREEDIETEIVTDTISVSILVHTCSSILILLLRLPINITYPI